MNPARFPLARRVSLLGLLVCLAIPASAAAVPPDNDGAGAARVIPLNSPVENQTNQEATTEGSEDLACGDAAYGRTVWYVFDVPAQGRVTITTSGQSFSTSNPNQNLDTVITLSPPGAIDVPEIACNDDGVAGNVGSSRIVQDLAAGQYFVQVGGFSYPPTEGDPEGFDYGPFTIEVRFEEDLDLDNDGFNRSPGPDCNDSNPAINPNASDTPYNGVDEDCRGGDNLDADGDGAPRGPDCDDGNAAIRPGAREIKGDFVDQNCDGRSPPARLSPTPSVRFTRVVARNSTVRKLVVSRLARGYRVVIQCKGPRKRRGCPGTQRRTAGSARSINFGAYKGRRLRPGSVVTIFVMRPGRNLLGQFFQYRIVANKIVDPKEGCLAPGKQRRTSCKT